ncbi:MAG: ankyrin repeat domain-containing protein, partial [Rickettsiales bacterium]
MKDSNINDQPPKQNQESRSIDLPTLNVLPIGEEDGDLASEAMNGNGSDYQRILSHENGNTFATRSDYSYNHAYEYQSIINYKNGNTAIHYLSTMTYRKACIALQKRNFNSINDQNNDGKTLLHLITSSYKEGSQSIVNLIPELIKLNANTEIKNNKGETPLMLAILCNQRAAAAAKLLIENGADINAKDENGNTIIHLAVLYIKYVSNLKRLFESLQQKIGKKLNEHLDIKNNNEETPLMLAASLGLIAAVEVLIKNGADVNVRNKDGKTALDLAPPVINNSFKVLITKTKEDQILAEMAMHGNEVEVTSLIEKGANRDRALAILATRNANEAAFNLLIAKGANRDGALAILAMRNANEAAFDLLIAKGANIDGALAILATGNANRDAFDLLIAKGANIDVALAILVMNNANEAALDLLIAKG